MNGHGHRTGCGGPKGSHEGILESLGDVEMGCIRWERFDQQEECLLRAVFRRMLWQLYFTMVAIMLLELV